MSDVPEDRSRSPWAGVLALGLAAGAACLAWERRARQRRHAVPPERLREALPAREPRALAYTRTRYATGLLSEALSLAFLWAWSRGGRGARLRAWAERVAPRPFARDMLFGGALLTSSTVVMLPYAFASGYLVERRFGLSTQSPASWLADSAKSFAVSLVIASPSVAGLYALIRRAPERWWLWAGGAWALLSVVLTNLAPLIIAPLFFRFTPLRDEDLRRRLTALAARAGVPVLGVFEADFSRKTRKANAYLTGIANSRRIVLTDTLLAGYTPDEIEAVLAHELGHHRFGHIWKGILLGTVGTLAGFAAADGALTRAGAAPEARGRGDVATLPALALFLSALGLATGPLGAALSRHWERQCDRFALEMTAQAGPFIGAMRKLSEQNLSDPCPPALIEALLYDHPSIRDRIAGALAWEAGEK